jgi:prophage regulatory protein
MPLRKIIRLPAVLDHTGLTRSTLYRKIAQGTFPRQVNISINGAGWYEADVARWIADPPAWRADNDNDEPGAKAVNHDAR